MKKHPVFVREFIDEFPEPPAVACRADGPGGLYEGMAEGLRHQFGKRKVWHALTKDTCPLPDNRVHALQYDSCGMLWIATESGVCVYDGTDCWLTPTQVDTLPTVPVYSLCIAENGWRCFGVQDALILLADGQSHYLGAKRWLPGGKVTQIAVRENAIYAKCEEGVARIEIKMMTLEEKTGQMHMPVTGGLRWNTPTSTVMNNTGDGNNSSGGGRIHDVALFKVGSLLSGGGSLPSLPGAFEHRVAPRRASR